MESLILSCRFCGHGNPAGARFCNACAEPLHLAPCPHCEAINSRTSARCHKCGGALDGATADALHTTRETIAHGATADAGGKPHIDGRTNHPAIVHAVETGDATTSAPGVFADAESQAWIGGDAPFTPGADHDVGVGSKHALSIPLAFSAAGHAGAHSPWREPPRRRRAPVIVALASVTVLALAYAVQHYGLPTSTPGTMVAASPPASPATATADSERTVTTNASAPMATATVPAADPPSSASDASGSLRTPDPSDATAAPTTASSGASPDNALADGNHPITGASAPAAGPDATPAAGCAPAVAALGLCDAAPTPSRR